MIESMKQSLGVSVLAHTPAALGTPSFIEKIDHRLNSYGHEISAFGGYTSANIGLLANLRELEAWLDKGLGRHIEVYNSYNVRIWEGFVNKISLATGGSTIERGPLIDVVNRCSVEYTPIIDPETEPPTTGTQTETTIAENTTSQAKYGILERVVAGGNLLDDGTTNDAEYVRDAFLADNSEARSSHEISISEGAGGDVVMTLECRGYIDWLDLYVYNDGTYNMSVFASDKIEYILAADPNGIFSTDYSKITTNAILVNGYEYQNRTAMTVLKEVVSCGDISNDRYLFGFYNNRRAEYSVVPTAHEYNYYRYSQNQSIQTAGGRIVYPWDVLPGKWAFIPDLLPGMTPKASVRSDPRMLFIENVSFSAPYSVTLQGSNILNMPQLMSRVGLGYIIR